jgi:TubC N-terminal docking domain
MTARDLLQHLQERGVVLTPYLDGTLRYKAPQGLLTSGLLDTMRQHKAALHELVEAVEERAAIAEYCGNLARPAAEALAWQYVLGEIPEHAPRTPVPVHSGDAR